MRQTSAAFFIQLKARNQLITSKKAAGWIVMAGDSLVVVNSPKNWRIADRRIEIETNAMKCFLVTRVFERDLSEADSDSMFVFA